jgi:hypothetical protein
MVVPTGAKNSTPPTRAKGSAQARSKASPGKGARKQPARDAQSIEAEIAEAEKKLAALSEQLAHPEVARDHNRLLALNQDYQQTGARLELLYEEWDRVATEATNN